MRIIVDYDLCESNAMCMEECPEVFRVNEADELEILNETPPETLRGKVEAAVRRCPRQALSLEDEKP